MIAALRALVGPAPGRPESIRPAQLGQAAGVAQVSRPVARLKLVRVVATSPTAAAGTRPLPA